MELKLFDFKKDSIVTIVNNIINDAIKLRATDIHFDTKEDGLLIKFRVNGDLNLYSKIDEENKKNIVTRVKILAGLNITEANKFQNSSFSYTFEKNDYTMRISTLPVVNGEKVVLHISNYDSKIPSLEELSFSEDNLLKIKNLVNNNYGTILITGSMFSGKNTTLYSILNGIDSEKNNIITIEKKIKVKLDNVNQVVVGRENVAEIINDSLMLDPNVIMIGEIDNASTANMVLKAANSGSLIISTMQSKNVYSAITTLLNMDIESYLLSSSLAGIISQRLVKRLCPHCRKTRETNDFEKQIFRKLLGKNVKEVYESNGCDKCYNGFDGRIPLAEVVIIDEDIKKGLSNKKEQKNLRKLLYDNNMTIIEDGLNRVLNGETTLEEIIRIIDLNNDFDNNADDLKAVIIGQLDGEEKVTNNESNVSNQEDEKKDDEKTENKSLEETKAEDNNENSTEVVVNNKNEVSDESKEDTKGNTETEFKQSDKVQEENEIVININNSAKDDDEVKTEKKDDNSDDKDEKTDNIVINIAENNTEEEKVVEEQKEEPQKEVKAKNIPSLDKMSSRKGLMKKNKTSYDDFDYSDMKAI